ncbi:biotin-dependent carboxyltransferase family protein [Saccharomonospora piscinae]|uniref:5-oxoprolinase subunit C family protein n=1 Tax=Saccharomonospora piscinae TaxID=687388 RepID=UPI000466F4A8|nr:biotin-dependent carboxyltransferase family protein [Saccharomonospora piscinae]
MTNSATRALEVLEPGPLATFQDLGRPGLAGIGVGASGAADRSALRLANRLVGNDEGAAAVEVTLGGFAARARGDLTVVVTGAPCPVTVGGRGGAAGSVLRVRAGECLRLGTPPVGLRSYVAVRGGFAVERVLGSASTDVLSGLGPPPLEPGTVLPVGVPHRPLPAVDFAPVTAPPADGLVLTVVPGPRQDWFHDDALPTLLRETYAVSPRSNRVGLRLEGPPLTRARGDELPSEGLVPGAVQVPPSGSPTLFLADHPVTGGYPVIAVVVAADVDRAAQARPGLTLRFAAARRPR